MRCARHRSLQFVVPGRELDASARKEHICPRCALILDRLQPMYSRLCGGIGAAHLQVGSIHCRSLLIEPYLPTVFTANSVRSGNSSLILIRGSFASYRLNKSCSWLEVQGQNFCGLGMLWYFALQAAALRSVKRLEMRYRQVLVCIRPIRPSSMFHGANSMWNR